jgi:acylphosphatase
MEGIVSEQASFKAIVRGRVQGVNFRIFVMYRAEALGLKGYVKNLSGGTAVEVWAEGEKTKLDELVKYLKNGPSRARVDSVDVKWSDYKGHFNDFRVSY